MSVFNYNNVTLPYAKVLDFVQTAKRDEVGDTDWYCSEFDVKVQCVVNFNYLNLLATDLNIGANATDNPSDIMRTIYSRLMTHRKRLSIRTNGVELIPRVAGNVGTVDAQNGPKPQSCQIVYLTNETFLIIYHIVAHYWENNHIRPANNPVVENRQGDNVLYNRWSESIELDDLMMTRRTRDGKFVIRSDNQDGFIADQIRSQMAVVGVPNGFMRENSSYTVDPSGLAIQYRVTDQEKYKIPIKGIYRAEGEYTETSTNYGAIRYGECHVKFWGPKGGILAPLSQSEILTKAVEVCSNKLYRRGVSFKQSNTGPGWVRIEGGTARVGMYENWVEVSIRAMMTCANALVHNIDGFAAIDTVTPGSDGATEAPFYHDRGSASRLLQAAKYYDPSLRNHNVSPTTGQLNVGVEVGQAGQTLEP